jgi:hypothetical protein
MKISNSFDPIVAISPGMNVNRAFKFYSDQTLIDLQKFLSDQMQVEWGFRNCDAYGSYIIIVKDKAGTLIRIYKEEEGFVVNFSIKSCMDTVKWMDEIEQLTTILEIGGAHNFAEVENYS